MCLNSGASGLVHRAYLAGTLAIAVILIQAVIATAAGAVELVNLSLASEARHFSPDNDVQYVRQEFSIPGPRILTINYVIEPRTAALSGGFSINTVDGSSFYLGREVYGKRTPDPCMPTSRCVTKQILVVSEPSKRLAARLTGPWVPQALQITNYGEQLGAKLALSITFQSIDQPFDQPSAAPPEVDFTGSWREGSDGQNWTFTPKGNGLYDAVESGFGNAKGTARVSGNTITVEFTNTTKYGDQTKGVWTAVMDPSGYTAQAGWITDNGELGTFVWTRKGSPEWMATAEKLRGQNGKQFTFVCPPWGVEEEHIWGTDVYEDGSPVCIAAVHAGLITFRDGGTVTIEIRPARNPTSAVSEMV